MTFTMSGLTTIFFWVVFIVAFALPAWAATKITGPKDTSLARTIFALFVGVIAALACSVFGGFLSVLLVPACFLLAFKFVLGTSILGALMLGMLALAGYAAMIHFIADHL